MTTSGKQCQQWTKQTPHKSIASILINNFEYEIVEIGRKTHADSVAAAVGFGGRLATYNEAVQVISYLQNESLFGAQKIIVPIYEPPTDKPV